MYDATRRGVQTICLGPPFVRESKMNKNCERKQQEVFWASSSGSTVYNFQKLVVEKSTAMLIFRRLLYRLVHLSRVAIACTACCLHQCMTGWGRHLVFYAQKCLPQSTIQYCSFQFLRLCPQPESPSLSVHYLHILINLVAVRSNSLHCSKYMRHAVIQNDAHHMLPPLPE